MKFSVRVFFFFLITGLLTSYRSHSQSAAGIQQEAKLLIATIKNQHYSPRPIDDQFSENLFEDFIHTLDPNQIYFREEDIKTIRGYKTLLDDELSDGSWTFLPKATDLFKQRLLAAEKLFSGILQKPFDYKLKDTVYFSGKDTSRYIKDDQEYKEWCNRWLKYHTLLRLSLSAPPSKSTQEIFAGEPKARQQVLIIESRKIKRILEHPTGYENYVASIFFNCISTSFDPHTNYMHKTEFENFQSRLSSESYSFGIDLEETDAGEISISRLVPGGPAWKSNEIHKGDVLTRLKWVTQREVDLTGADIDEVEQILSESNTEKMEFTFRKINGLSLSVTLQKEKIETDENIVKSYLIKGEKKIGYISLPGFYTEWENFSGLGCATDVAKAILKLKAENIEGLILDLRYNGGGSLYEGLNLAGIFINEGPLTVIQARNEKPMVLKDMNRGTVYDGPLVVMVNGSSASASEIVASTLQDYNRAVVVGGPTYGKATGQVLLPLDSTDNLSDYRSSFGVIKITTEKLYRITGGSAQLKGVIPDVYLPDIYEQLNFREITNENALPNDSIVKKVYYSKLSPIPLKGLSKNSSERISKDERFAVTKNIIQDYKKVMEEYDVLPLEFSALQKRNNAIAELGIKFEKAGSSDVSNIQITHLQDEAEILKIDAYRKDLDAILRKRIQSDIYIEESFRIISDLINLTK